jgi:hypothetical protein
MTAAKSAERTSGHARKWTARDPLRSFSNGGFAVANFELQQLAEFAFIVNRGVQS